MEHPPLGEGAPPGPSVPAPPRGARSPARGLCRRAGAGQGRPGGAGAGPRGHGGAVGRPPGSGPAPPRPGLLRRCPFQHGDPPGPTPQSKAWPPAPHGPPSAAMAAEGSWSGAPGPPDPRPPRRYLLRLRIARESRLQLAHNFQHRLRHFYCWTGLHAGSGFTARWQTLGFPQLGAILAPGRKRKPLLLLPRVVNNNGAPSWVLASDEGWKDPFAILGAGKKLLGLEAVAILSAGKRVQSEPVPSFEAPSVSSSKASEDRSQALKTLEYQGACRSPVPSHPAQYARRPCTKVHTSSPPRPTPRGSLRMLDLGLTHSAKRSKYSTRMHLDAGHGNPRAHQQRTWLLGPDPAMPRTSRARPLASHGSPRGPTQRAGRRVLQAGRHRCSGPPVPFLDKAVTGDETGQEQCNYCKITDDKHRRFRLKVMVKHHRTTRR